MLIIFPSNETNDSDIVIMTYSWKCLIVKPVIQNLHWNKISTQRTIVFCKGIFVKWDSTLKLAITRLGSQLKTSSAKGNESLMVYLITLIGSNIGRKNFAIIPFSQ